MRISLDWISDFVDLAGLSPEAIADRLTLGTAEVEDWVRIGAGVVAGRVIDLRPLGDGKQVATVDVGSAQVRTVCGAPNVTVGIVAPFAGVGAVVAGGKVIGAGEVAGVHSEGMLCSPAELGRAEGHEGLLPLAASAAPGTPIADLLGPGDVLIEIDNKSITHRPDLWGHYGFAREFSALYHRPLKPLPIVDLARYAGLPEFPIAIADLDNCPAYCGLKLSLGTVPPATAAVRRRLHALGQRTYDLIVDLTNYIMLELGQPMHAFDGAAMARVRVAALGKAGEFTPLDGQTRKLAAEDLMIWNQEGPVAVAGIMGGQNSEFHAGATNLLLESANFKPARIRRTAQRLDLRTEAAMRFEKGQPPVNTRVAIARFLQLLDDAGLTYQVETRLSTAGNLDADYRTIDLPADFITRRAGTAVPAAEVERILTALGFRLESRADGGLRVSVPPFRSRADLSIPEDLLEEVLRVYGYDAIPPQLPAVAVSPTPFDKPLRTQHRARRLLSGGHAFAEVQTRSWFDDAWLRQLGFDPGPTLRVRNPQSPEFARMRTTLVPGLLTLVDKNRLHAEAFRLYEVGRVYVPQPDAPHVEYASLAAVSYRASKAGTEEHYLELRGVLEDLARVLVGQSLRFAEITTPLSPWAVPGQAAALYLGEVAVGSVGLVPPALRPKITPGGQIAWFEIDLRRLTGPLYPTGKFSRPSEYPVSNHDFSLLWPNEKTYAELVALLDEFVHPLVQQRDFIGLYRGKELAEVGSFTFRYTVGSLDRTLTGDEIEGFRAALLAFLADRQIPIR